MRPYLDLGLSGAADAGTQGAAPSLPQREPGASRLRAGMRWICIGALFGIGLLLGMHAGRFILAGACASLLEVERFTDGR